MTNLNTACGCADIDTEDCDSGPSKAAHRAHAPTRARVWVTARDSSTKLYLGWGGAMVITALWVAPGGFLLLCLGLAIGGVAYVALHRNCPDLFAPRAAAREGEAAPRALSKA